MTAKSPRFAVLIPTVLLLSLHSMAYSGDGFPGPSLDPQSIKTQQKVDSLFEKGDYERALFIYREELAPLGDKYAQYMIGYMHLTGKGTRQDIIDASAWYRLAAERGQPHFSRARDEIMAILGPGLRRDSNRKYLALREKYSDASVVANLVETDLQILSDLNATKGTFVPGTAGPGYGIDGAGDGTESSDALIKKIAGRMRFLESQFSEGKTYSDDEYARFEALRKRVRAATRN